MTVDEITAVEILPAIKYVDEHGWESKHNSTKYDLIVEGEKRFPPKYVLAVAMHLTTGEAINTQQFNGGEPTNRHFKRNGFKIIKK